MREMNQKQQMENLNKAWDLLNEAWNLVYVCDESVGQGSPFEPVRSEINSATVSLQELQKQLELEVSK